MASGNETMALVMDWMMTSIQLRLRNPVHCDRVVVNGWCQLKF
jgi:hypothetical protein